MKTINDGKSYFYHIIFCMIACAFSLTGCVKEIDRTEDGQTFYFKIEEDLREFDFMKTKGVLSDIFCIDENGIGNVAVYAYDLGSGMYHTSCYIENYTGTEPCKLELRRNSQYKIFAIVNMGKPDTAPADMTDMENYVHKIGTWKETVDRYGFLPMSGNTTIDTEAGKSFTVFVKRLVAEINMNYTASEGLGIRPDSVKIINAPLEISPFADNRPVSYGEGDRGTESDIEIFADGGSIRMFMLENMNYGTGAPVAPTVQDAGIPGPDNLSYIEFYGRIINSTGIISGNIKYRILLDFDIERNKKYNINFSVTPEGIYEDSWRVTVSDAVFEMGSDIYMVENSEMTYGIPAQEYTGVTYASGDESIVRYAGGKLYSGKPGKTTLTATSENPDAYGMINVTVLSTEEDDVTVSDCEALLGMECDIPFKADNGKRLTISGSAWNLDMDISEDNDGDVRVAENNLVRLEYDPVGTDDKKITVLVKDLKLGVDETYKGVIETITGRKEEFDITATIPELNIMCRTNQLTVNGRSEKLYLYLSHDGKMLKRADFDSDIYNRFYQNIAHVSDFETTRHIKVEQTFDQYIFDVYGIAADGSGSYTGTLRFRLKGALGSNAKGSAEYMMIVNP